MHGDAFQVVYSEIPQQLLVVHDPEIPAGGTTFTITATDSSFICLTVSNEIIATAYGDAPAPVVMSIPPQTDGTMVLVTVTKQNYFRYTGIVPVTSNIIPNFMANSINNCEGASVDFMDLSSGNPDTWEWTFTGGNPSTSNLQHPTGIVYSTTGNFNVSLTITKAGQPSKMMTKTEYIHVYPYPDAEFSATTECAGDPVFFMDQTLSNGGIVTYWKWNFGDYSSPGNISFLQNPEHTYNSPGIYPVSLTVKNNDMCEDMTVKNITVISIPGQASVPSGNTEVCKDSGGYVYTTAGATFATDFIWEIAPSEAGLLHGNTASVIFDPDTTFIGVASIKVKGWNKCGEGIFSDSFFFAIQPPPWIPETPTGPDSVDTHLVTTSGFNTTGGLYANFYNWSINPVNAGTIEGTGISAEVNWTKTYKGEAFVSVSSINSCGESDLAGSHPVMIYSTLGIADKEIPGVEIYPNPNNGRFTLEINSIGEKTISIQIYNIPGKVIFAEPDVPVRGKTYRTITLDSPPEGLYHMKIEGEKGSVIKRFVVN
jgi:PKD repeat protein